VDQDAGLVVEGEDYDVHSRRWPVVKAALLAGLYPKVVRLYIYIFIDI
jgi:hypothetical protein